jgi:hypothetical protein
LEALVFLVLALDRWLSVVMIVSSSAILTPRLERKQPSVTSATAIGRRSLIGERIRLAYRVSQPCLWSEEALPVERGYETQAKALPEVREIPMWKDNAWTRKGATCKCESTLLVVKNRRGLDQPIMKHKTVENWPTPHLAELGY